jgi:hypothetical protein
MSADMMLCKLYVELDKLELVNTDIIVEPIEKVIQFLHLNVCNSGHLFIRCYNSTSLVLIFTDIPSTVKTLTTIYDLIHFLNKGCTFISVNHAVLFGSPEIREIVEDRVIVRQFDTFFQSNQLVAAIIHKKVTNSLTNSVDSICFIGGECYVYAKLLFNYWSRCVILSDYDDIVHYSKLNLRIESDLKQIVIKKVDYRYSIPNFDASCLIINVRSLLPSHVAAITMTGAKIIVVISCNDNNIKKLKALTEYTLSVEPVYNIKMITLTKMSSISAI